MQATCPTISKRRLAQHSKDNFTYLHLDYHQHAPEIAGTPGLFFNSHPGPDWPGLQRVFTRIESNKWQFMGMYEIKSCASLTKEEWKCQKEKACFIIVSMKCCALKKSPRFVTPGPERFAARDGLRKSVVACVDVLTSDVNQQKPRWKKL